MYLIIQKSNNVSPTPPLGKIIEKEAMLETISGLPESPYKTNKQQPKNSISGSL